MDNSKIFIIFFIIFFFVFGRGLDFVVSGFNNINEQSQRVSKESVATDFYHSVNYGLNTINFELDNLVSNINTETKSTLDDIEIILTSINRRTNFVTTKESLALVSVPNFNFNITEQFAVTWYRTVSGLFKVNSLQFTVDSKSEELATLETTTTSGSLSLTGQAVDGVNEDEVSQSETSSNNQPTTPLETTTVSDSLSLTGQATTQNSTVREIVKETVVERVIQASGITLEDLQKLNNELRSEIYKISANTGSQINNVYQVVSATNNIDQLNGITMERINMTDSNVSGTNLNFNNGSISNLTGGSATFDTDTLYIDNINHRVGIGTTSPFRKLSVEGSAWISGDLTANSITATSSISAPYFTATDSTATSTFAGGLTVGTNKLMVDRITNNVGIGTVSPSQQLEITGDFEMPNTTFADQSGIIYKGANSFIHNFNYGNNGTVTTLGYNTFVGENAGSFTMGSTATETYHSSRNTAVGYQSLLANTTGYYNTASGYQSLRLNTAGGYNTANGMQSLYSNTTGNYNAANGANSLYLNATGSNNTANGQASLYANTTGSSNVAEGYNAGRYITDGVTGNTTGDYNIFIGRDTKALADDDQNEIVIGYNATGVGSNSVVLGNDSIVTTVLKWNVGIGTTSPFAKLSVVGDVVADYFNTTSTTATSTFAGGLTVGTNKLVVDRSTGNVGIGTTSPSYKLDVDGSFRSGSLKINGSTLSNTTDSTTYLSGGTTSGIGANLTLFGSSHSTTPNVARFRVGATEMLRIDATGNVGIGTTSPFAKLSVTGTGTGTGSAFQVADSANSPKFTVLDNGNVGIGTTSPSGLLHLQSSASDVALYVERDSQYKGAFTGYRSNGSMLWAVGLLKDSGHGNVKFGISSTNTLENAKLVIDTAGNVGIGTTSPDKPPQIVNSERRLLSLHQNGNNAALIKFTNTQTGTADGNGL